MSKSKDEEEEVAEGEEEEEERRRRNSFPDLDDDDDDFLPPIDPQRSIIFSLSYFFYHQWTSNIDLNIVILQLEDG